MFARILRRVPVSVLAGVLLAGHGAVAAPQDPPAAAPVRYPYEFGSSSAPMVRNAQLFSAAGALVDRAAGAAIDEATGHLFEKRGSKAVLARIARLYFLDMPVASLAQVFNHEYGHITRKTNARGHSVAIEDWPWPVPFAGPRLSVDWMAPDDPMMFLASVAGGSEASHVMADALIERAYSADRASYFDMLLYVYGKLDPSAYAIVYSGPSRPYTDPWSYAGVVTYLRRRPFRVWPEDTAAEFKSARTAAWLNLLDYALVANIEGVVSDYVIDGRPLVRPRWVQAGPVRLVPGFDYTPTPRGQQYRVNCRMRVRTTSANVYARWTQPLKDGSVDELARQYEQAASTRYHRLVDIRVPSVVRLLGIGGEIRWPGGRALTPSITADAWRDIDRHFAGRAELGATWHHPALGKTRAVRVAVGGKSAGYLPGSPDTRGAYLVASLLADF